MLSYLLPSASSLNIIQGHAVKSLSNHDNMVELECHFRVDMHRNKLRYLLIPYLSYLGLLSSNPLYINSIDYKNNAIDIIYDESIHFLDQYNLQLHWHNMSDLL